MKRFLLGFLSIGFCFFCLPAENTFAFEETYTPRESVYFEQDRLERKKFRIRFFDRFRSREEIKRPGGKDKKRRALDVVRRHKNHISAVRDRVQSIITLLDQANRSKGNLKTIVDRLDYEVTILDGLEQKIENRTITREIMRSTLEQQRMAMRELMGTLRVELMRILEQLRKA